MEKVYGLLITILFNIQFKTYPQKGESKMCDDTKLKWADSLRVGILLDIDDERNRQNHKWGKQRHDNGKWLQILVEEVGEVAQAMQKENGWGKDTDASDLYTELIHVAAVAVSIAEQVKEEK